MSRISNRRTGLRVVLWTLLAVTLIMPLGARQAAAHPLGNFSINLYSRLEVEAERVDVVYIVDMAEIPTFQAFGGEVPQGAAREAHLARSAAMLSQGLQLVVDGRAHELQIIQQALSFPPGQGDLLTTRIELRLQTAVARLAAGAERSLEYRDTNYLDRLGWREVVARAGQGVRLAASDVPSEDRSNELRTYPQDLLQSPPDVREAHLRATPGAATVSSALVAPVTAGVRSDDRLAALITTAELSPLVALVAFALALGFGAAHALSPGHGKAIVGAYLVGTRGTARHALFLGLTVTITHTLGVFGLGLVTLFAQRFILPEQLFPVLGLMSGALVVVIGGTLLNQRVRAWRMQAVAHPHDHHHAHDHEHTHDHHHAHDHDHTHDHHPHTHTHDEHGHHHHSLSLEHVHGPGGHTHLPPGADGSRVTWRSLLALGVSGGLIPCPSALVLMLSAISLNRVGIGLLLIVAFSLGLAGVLTGIGLLFVYSARWLQRQSEGRLRNGVLQLAPIVSAVFVTTAGVIITWRAIIEAGWLR